MESLPIGEIERLIAEDAPFGDLTTEALAIGDFGGRLRFACRTETVLAGVEVAADVFRLAGAEVKILLRSGAAAPADAPFLEAAGSARALHRGWKVALSLIEALSGVATATRRMVDLVEAMNPAVRVACTRKTFPGARRLSQLAVEAGGGIVHRHSLSETILVFRQHRVFASTMTLREIAGRLRHAAPEKKLVFEALDGQEAAEAMVAGFDAVQLDKMSPGAVAELAHLARSFERSILLIAAGGVTPRNVADYVAAGAGLIVTSWPYAARPADIAATMTAA